jgi:hypothetical protein
VVFGFVAVYLDVYYDYLCALLVREPYVDL